MDFIRRCVRSAARIRRVRRFLLHFLRGKRGVIFVFVISAIFIIPFIYLVYCAATENPDPNKGFKCGVITEQTSSLIINGSEAPLGYVPWFVELKIRDRRKPHCGASIIASEWAVTAAHCDLCKFKLSKDCGIIVAGSQYSLNNSAGTVHNVVKFHKFNEEDTRTVPSHDIALIKVDPPFKYRKHGTGDERAIGSVCLPIADSAVTEKEGVVSGFGINNLYHAVYATRLMTVNIKILEWPECFNEIYRYPIRIEFDEKFKICGNTLEESKGICNGDSGGPLTVIRNNEVTIIGITSTGIGCATNTANYVNVAAYRKWIQEIANV